LLFPNRDRLEILGNVPANDLKHQLRTVAPTRLTKVSDRERTRIRPETMSRQEFIKAGIEAVEDGLIVLRHVPARTIECR
jgi:hypothetical protein